MELINTPVSGCYKIKFNVLKDSRGEFVKTFHQTDFELLGLCTDWKEEYYSLSHKNVLRGMHFQVPPADHVKFVFCVTGEVLDVAVDLRKASSTYGQCYSTILSPERGEALYLPPGIAHGFLSLTDETLMYYKVTSVYSPEYDAGVLWSSLSFKWPAKTPIVSKRDQSFPIIADFDTPFL